MGDYNTTFLLSRINSRDQKSCEGWRPPPPPAPHTPQNQTSSYIPLHPQADRRSEKLSGIQKRVQGIFLWCASVGFRGALVLGNCCPGAVDVGRFSNFVGNVGNAEMVRGTKRLTSEDRV